MPDKPRRVDDLRAYLRREDRRLVFVIMAFLVVVGGAAISIVYGWTTATTGILCLAAGAGIIGLLWLILTLIERWLGRE
jgi:fucose permease